MAATLQLTYPLSKSQADQIVEFQNEDNAIIDKELEEIRAHCAEQCQSDTTKCREHSKEIRRLWRTYYTNPRPGSWASYRPEEYFDEMRKLFDFGSSIKQIHARASQERRLHARDALCTVRFNDDLLVKQYKNEARTQFGSDIPEQQIRDFILQKQTEVEGKRTPRQREYDSKLAACENEQQKLELYKEDACTPLETDTPAMLKLRIKWRPLFESGMPYPEIYATMRKDIDLNKKSERELREKDAEFQRAKTAHDKVEFAKAEKKKAIEWSARQRMLKRYTFQCAGHGCQNLAVPISEEVGLLECGICYKLYNDGIFNRHSYFCSEDCMDDAGRDHILDKHACVAATACTTGISHRSINESFCGICVDCWKHFRVVSYFCTPKCLQKNYRDHALQSHPALRAELTQKLLESDSAWEEFRHKYKVTEEDLTRAMADAPLSA